ncbi:MAG: 2OG-Fe(II) oxygenase [Pseudomonadota bacterium]
MAVLDFVGNSGSPRFQEDQCIEKGRALAERYQNAEPFPHIMIEDFLPIELLRDVAEHFPEKEHARSFNRKQENLKFQFHPEDVPHDPTRNLLAALNSQPFLNFLSAMTGIEGLIADPYYAGGGLHQTFRGGHLGVHADFNNHKIMHVRRRLNVLVYLNEDWDDSYGGHLELWSKDMKEMHHRIAPLIGRCVVFSTNLDSYHGHPDPLNTPDGVSRRSIATYYYTSTADINDQPDRTTNFMSRPGSHDATDYSVKLRHLAKDWLPPALLRMVGKSH